ncbi:uncharacterized protein LOC131360692 [Hemibagrus wyckioides]|uniref:uncharacterized protein LOC131360692 n=1 Tax=Hemibagrus wyckioides TaxID=337641 RepID=UPI00266C0945|nr:uncharacterized protein LOC131360692 [Hemibagrus wyckioides]
MFLYSLSVLALLREEDSSESVDSSHFTELSQTPPELVELVHEAPLDEEDALLSNKESTDSGDSTHTSEVSLSSPELVVVLQEVSLDDAEHLPRPPSQPKRRSPTALKRRVCKTKVSKSDGEICDRMKESVSLVKSSSLQDCVLMSHEVTEQTLQDPPLDKEDAPVSDEKSSDSGDGTDSPTSSDPAELLLETPLDEEHALLIEGDSSESDKSSHFTELSQTPPECAEHLHEAPLDKISK